MTDIRTPIPQSELHEIYDAVCRRDHEIAKALLERTMGREPNKLFINGHVFETNPDPDEGLGKWCIGSGCEMFHPRWAEVQEHPANYEGLEWADTSWGIEEQRQWEAERDWYNNE